MPFFTIDAFIASHCLFLLLLSHSSFLIFLSPSGSCSLIYFYPSAWKESRQEQNRKDRHTLNLVISPPVLPGSTSLLFYLHINQPLTASLPQFYTVFLNISTFHPQLCLDLYTFLYLNFYFSLFAALNLDPAVFSLTPTTICFYSSHCNRSFSSVVVQANLRKFMDLIQHNQVDKVSKMLERGFDPNYHDSETGGKAASCTCLTQNKNVT